ncbi:MAG: class D sortase, partial [Rudaea sp.]
NRGTGRSELLRGAGLVTGSALPGSNGNVSIAAHRDSYFRGLRNIKAGDIVELDSLEHKNLYRVTNTKIVEPTDVNVLADVGEPVLTLITCYPFYFIGSAPQRFIVRAVATDIRRKTQGAPNEKYQENSNLGNDSQFGHRGRRIRPAADQFPG